MWPFGTQPTKPVTVPTDTVIPFHSQDDTDVYRAIVMDFTLRFDDVLDPEKIRWALVRLMELGNWRKLGARMRLNDQGKLEYHVPASFSEERPGFSYSHVQNQISIENDPLASRLPKATAHPSVHPDPLEFSSLTRHSSSPIKFEDYVYNDAPQLSLHVVSFEDATLVTLSWPHTFSDAMGAAALFDAWTLVLNGKESDVPPLIGFDSDPLATFGSSPAEKFTLADLQIKGVNMAIWAARYIYELVWYRQEEGRIVCIPASTFSSIKEATLLEVEAQKPFLSDGDVLSAWWTRQVLQQMPWAWNRTLSVMNAYSFRGILSESLLPSGTSYVSNAVGGVYAILSCPDVLSKPISFTALAVRRSIIEQGTKSQMEAFSAIFSKGPCVFGYPNTFMFVYTNWTKGKFYDANFSGAVVREGIPVSKRMNAVGRPSYIHVAGHSEKYSSRNAFPVFGKDAAGNYWLAGRLRAGVWAKIEEALTNL